MKLHYSQTKRILLFFHPIVLIPYEITLLSNFKQRRIGTALVLIPYEITLLSNKQH